MAKDNNREAQASIFGQVASLANLVEYQTGSVVSRTLAKQPSGSVTLFAFDRDQALSEHTAPFDALVHVIEGGVEISIADATHRLAAGDVIIMPANVPHAVRAVERFKMVLIMLKA